MRSYAIVFLLCLFVLRGGASGADITWKPADAPSPSLIEAYQAADSALKPYGKGYHCLAASVSKNSSDCDWLFTFSSREGKQLWVSVDSNKKAVVRDHLLLH